MEEFIAGIAVAATIVGFTCWILFADPTRCDYVPAVTEADTRLCAPATYHSDCFSRLGYKRVCKKVETK